MVITVLLSAKPIRLPDILPSMKRPSSSHTIKAENIRTNIPETVMPQGNFLLEFFFFSRLGSIRLMMSEKGRSPIKRTFNIF